MERRDPTWKYTSLIDSNNTNDHTCIFCGKETRGGITRQKEHLIGSKRIRKNVLLCEKVPPEVREELQKYEKEKAERAKHKIVKDCPSKIQKRKLQKNEKEQKNLRKQKLMENIPDFDDDDDDVLIIDEVDEVFDDNDMLEIDEVDEVQEDAHARKNGKAPIAKNTSISSKASISISSELCAKKKGSMDCFVTPDLTLEHKEMVERVHQDIARFWYQAEIPFNAVNLKSFRAMLKSVGQFGPHLPSPSYHQLRNPLLDKELKHTQILLKEHKATWISKGCSFMTERWTNRTSRTLINFLVNSPRGTIFIKSIDASTDIKTDNRMFEILEEQLQDLHKEIGEENVIQVITDNTSNLKRAGERLQEKYKLYWTPCVTHCLNLILEDLANIPKVRRALTNAMKVTGFIYSHTEIINMLREFTQKRDLVRPAKTRFATSYITLQRIYKQKKDLRRMFTDDVWKNSSLSKEEEGTTVEDIILMSSFWNNVHYAIKLTTPLVRLLKLFDNEKKPAMGYIYEAMDRIKKGIASAFGGEENFYQYKKAYEYIDKRWEIQLHRPLHAAAYYLNPAYFYDNPKIQDDKKIEDGLHDVIAKLVEQRLHVHVKEDLEIYKNCRRSFGNQMAKDNRKKMSPVDWWENFGSSAYHLQRPAIRILNLTCSASGCERNWSAFEQIHSKKRNKLDHQRLNDLAYIKYNQKMMERHETEDVTDSINLFDIEDSNEWHFGEFGEGDDNAENELVFDNDDLTLHEISSSAGVELIHNKKRNKLDHQRLNDLAYIKYNQKMMERHETEDVTDPINLFDIEDSNEWRLGEFGEGNDNAENELVFDNDDLTLHEISSSAGVELVSEEREHALAKLGRPARLDGRSPPKQIEVPDGRKLQLHFKSKLSLPLFTGGKVEGEQGAAIHVVLLDANTGHVVTSGPESSAKLDLVVLEGDFNSEDEPDWTDEESDNSEDEAEWTDEESDNSEVDVDEWTTEEFERHIVTEREGKIPLLTGDLQISLKEGVGTLGELTFTDNSSWTRSGKFRLGLKVASGFCDGIRVREAKTEAFTVKRGYKKHYPPALRDKVWRLEKISKYGSFHERLNEAGIVTVEDFLWLLDEDSQWLRDVLGSGMSTEMWESLVDHAKTCDLSGKHYIYYSDERRSDAAVFNSIYEFTGLIANGQYYAAECLTDSQKVVVDSLVKKAYDNWGRVIEYDGKALLDHNQSMGASTSTCNNGMPFRDLVSISSLHCENEDNMLITKCRSATVSLYPASYCENGDSMGGNNIQDFGWLKIEAAKRWGIFVRRKAEERRAQLVELED